jgi:uncharacterized protein
METDKALQATRLWVERVVVGLNLCPFAERVLKPGRIAFELSNAQTIETFLEDAVASARKLVRSERNSVETTLLIYPKAPADFYEFYDWVGASQELFQSLHFDGVLQVVAFHPKFEFEGSTTEEVTHYTNRSPYPMLHFLREESVTEVAESHPDLLQIPQNNIAKLNQVGLPHIEQLVKSCSE